ncbi:YicC family protein [Verticiella sediminum]|uniref:YicC family protein n=1 Tax=Verticiella sediminum TaxID=1247510 RepID=A0A556AYF9_9BURK|nr:YicC/YloC family endoribonuclease [Verticiella sediminum]TSH97962.1 YicC family protein [Verticiella sediminum]
MIRSMTAFGSASVNLPIGTVTLELRSVNSRYLDLYFRVPDELRHLEAALRERLCAAVPRGKVEVRANLLRRAQTDPGRINIAALQGAAELLQAVRAVVPDTAAPRLAELLAWPGVQADADDPAQWDEAVLAACNQALVQFQQARDAEGARLAGVMREKASAIGEVLEQVQGQLPQILNDYRERLGRKLRDTVATAFPGGFQNISGAELSERLAQEATLFTLRIDVDEELARLKSHLTELDRILGGGGASGRGRPSGSPGKRLDFLFQEMNREANTLGSKAGAIEMTRAAVDLKLLIEQLREQAQNIE